jgi:hypothetical protein
MVDRELGYIPVGRASGLVADAEEMNPGKFFVLGTSICVTDWA